MAKRGRRRDEKVQTEVGEMNRAKKRVEEEDEKRNRSSCRRCRHVLHFKVCELWGRQKQHPAPCTLPDESTKWQKNTEQQEFALAVSVPVASASMPFSGCNCQQQGNTTNYANLPATSCRPHASQSIPIKVKPQPASSERTMPISRQFGMHLLQHWRVATANYPFET